MGDNFAEAAQRKRVESQYVLEEVEWLLGNGATPYEVSDALGRTVSSLGTIMRRHGRPDLAAPFERIVSESRFATRPRGKGW